MGDDWSRGKSGSVQRRWGIGKGSKKKRAVRGLRGFEIDDRAVIGDDTDGG
jgi:hypothetical protein